MAKVLGSTLRRVPESVAKLRGRASKSAQGCRPNQRVDPPDENPRDEERRLRRLYFPSLAKILPLTSRRVLYRRLRAGREDDLSCRCPCRAARAGVIGILSVHCKGRGGSSPPPGTRFGVVIAPALLLVLAMGYL